jgi:hypothetical protein
VFRKVANGFRSNWSTQGYAEYRSVNGTVRIGEQFALAAVRDLVDDTLALCLINSPAAQSGEQLRMRRIAPYQNGLS